MKDKVEEAWLRILGSSNVKFSRDVAYPWRVEVHNPNQYIESIQKRVKTNSVYASIYSYPEIKSRKYGRLFIDIDAEGNLEEGYKTMTSLVKWLRENYDCEPLVLYTGGRGWAIHVYFPLTRVSGESMRRFVLSFPNINQHVDTHVVGDVRRIARLPYTLNFNNLNRGEPVRLCVPVNPKWSLQEMLAESKECRFKHEVYVEPCKAISLELKKIQESVEDEPNGRELPTSNVDDELLGRLLEWAPNIKDGRHRLLTFVVIRNLVWAGWSDDEILEYCRAFIKKTGRPFKNLDSFVKRHIRDCRLGPNRDASVPWRPWRFDVFLYHNQDLIPYYRR